MRRRSGRSLAITDHGVMYGVIDFINMPFQRNQPIIGCEVYVAPRSRFER
ncbi:MAG: PHP domain-containing protein [Oscillospiraceae bacterium]